MSAAIPTWREVWFKAKRGKRRIVAEVMLANDTVCLVQFGPRGGWVILK